MSLWRKSLWTGNHKNTNEELIEEISEVSTKKSTKKALIDESDN